MVVNLPGAAGPYEVKLEKTGERLPDRRERTSFTIPPGDGRILLAMD